MTQVFLSYRRADAALAAHALRYALLHGGFDVFLDTGDIEPGDHFHARIVPAIAASHLLLAVVGPDFDVARLHQPGDWVAMEWNYARFAKLPVVLVLADREKMGPPPLAALPPQLRWIDEALAFPVRRESLTADIDAIVHSVPAHAAKAGRGVARVLWVDDRPSNNENERRILRADGISFDNVVSTAEAVEQLRVAAYDLIITDVARRDSSDRSSDAATPLLERPEVKALGPPVIVYSSYAVQEKLGPALVQQGAFGVVSSPYALRELVLAALGKPA